MRLAYSAYALAVLLALGLPTLVVLLVLPGLARRRALARLAARTFLRMVGIKLEVRHLGRLPNAQCILVSNHASYLDGLVYTAALPPRFGFVIKREMRRVPLAGLLLRRIGSEFVERFNRHKSGADARRLLRAAKNGDSLAFFPEGTFAPTRGLLKFHTGAFVVAARSGCAVVPATIRGTRDALPAGSILLHPGRLIIEVLPPLAAPNSSLESAAQELRERARAVILANLGEPDLTATSTAASMAREA